MWFHNDPQYNYFDMEDSYFFMIVKVNLNTFFVYIALRFS